MENPKIYSSIISTMKSVGAVAKGEFNTYDKYKFRGIDAVMNALGPAMRQNGIFCTPHVLSHIQEARDSRKGEKLMYTIVHVEYTFYADDGSSVKADVYGEAMDRSDKSTNKAMSAAFKYALFQTFCIPTEDFIDTETESPEPEQQKPVNKKKQDSEPDCPREEAFPPIDQMVSELIEKSNGNHVMTDFINRAMIQANARDLSELAYSNPNMIKAWWEKVCQKKG